MSITQYENRNELATSQDVAVHRLGEWAHSAQAAHQVATTLVQTSFCPEAFRNKPGEATAAILAGMEVGLQPMAALRSFDVIQGQAAPRAITLRAILQSAGHEMVLVESTDSRCRMKGKRRGSNEWQTVTWTMDRARSLGLANKPNWTKQPAAMLVARASSELARLIASDAILGIPYSVEEIADGGSFDEQVATETATPSSTGGTRMMSRRAPTNSGPDEAPADPGGEAVEPTQASGSESVLLNTSSKLAKALFAGINEAGITEAERLPWISHTLGREVGSSKELTEDETRTLLRALDEINAPVDGEVVP